jgi:transposase
MMGQHQPQNELFSYSVNLGKRVRDNHPLRRIQELIDFSFVRSAVADRYGCNGHESTDPVIIVKMMVLLFLDNVESERELMRIVAERLDYLWFLGMGLDDEVPNHSVLSKARRRWGPELFRELFVRVVAQCVAAGLVRGDKIHMDGSLVDADAGNSSVLKGSPELVAQLRKVYESEERKLDERGSSSNPKPERVNDGAMSTTDPDSALVKKDGASRLRYKHHRVVDDAHGVITAVKTTAGDARENGQLMTLIEQHEANTGIEVSTAIGDCQYGTSENMRACAQEGIRCHLGDFREKQEGKGRREGIYAEDAFVYDAATDTCRCPAGQTLTRRKHKKKRNAWEYAAGAATCRACPLRSRCTRARGTARSIKRHEGQQLIDRARAQSRSAAAVRDRIRRRWRMEGSFADAANHHGFKRARWRRRWRQSIQDYMISTVQNIRILLRRGTGPAKAAAAGQTNLQNSTFTDAVASRTPRMIFTTTRGDLITTCSLN